MKLELFWILLCCPMLLFGQDCNIQLSGSIKDEYSNEKLEFATLILEGTNLSAVTDIEGKFAIDKICPGDYHLIVSHIGCENERVFLRVTQDTIINISLHHHSELLQEILVEGAAADRSKTGTRKTLNQEAIEEGSGGTLAELTQRVTGVTLLRNGSNIAKPIIHGLTGNRVAILNNGELQAGQQWGNDHAPEIDPFSAQKITVIKGAEGVRYGGNALGGIVLVEPGTIANDPHLHGLAQYVFNGNGRGHTANLSLEKGGGWLPWRLKLGGTKSGDHKAPNYFLRNTGQENMHGSLQLKKQLDHWSHEAYYSFYQTELGILRGSHIGNTTDLERAIVQTEPFNTEPTFSYAIGSPRQTVQHHLWKAHSRYFFGKDNFLAFSYSGQLNQRREFDVRRNNLSDVPALSLSMWAQHGQAIYHRDFDSKLHIETGFQWRFNFNKNDPSIDVFPLIPDYTLYNPGLFALLKKEEDQMSYDLGVRYDYKFLAVRRFTREVPSVYETPEHQFSNFTFLGGMARSFSAKYNSRVQVGWVRRTPEINELYSSGLHQGVASIEEGNADLRPESSVKLLWTHNLNIGNKLFIEASAYFNPIKDYIFLEPQPEFLLTIRGAFPYFIYKQADATIWGIDFYKKWEVSDHLNWVNKLSWVSGQNNTANEPLINIPPLDMESTIEYSFHSTGFIENLEASLTARYVAQQKRFVPQQYFLDPPPGYFLMNASLSGSIPLGQHRLQVSLSGNNVLNKSYRSFLNRLRYFSDEEGAGFSINLRYKF